MVLFPWRLISKNLLILLNGIFLSKPYTGLVSLWIFVLGLRVFLNKQGSLFWIMGWQKVILEALRAWGKKILCLLFFLVLLRIFWVTCSYISLWEKVITNVLSMELLFSNSSFLYRRCPFILYGIFSEIKLCHGCFESLWLLV